MESFTRTDYQCTCPVCGTIMTPFRDLDGHTAYGCKECGRVIENETYFLNLPLPATTAHAVAW